MHVIIYGELTQRIGFHSVKFFCSDWRTFSNHLQSSHGLGGPYPSMHWVEKPKPRYVFKEIPIETQRVITQWKNYWSKRLRGSEAHFPHRTATDCKHQPDSDFPNAVILLQCALEAHNKVKQKCIRCTTHKKAGNNNKLNVLNAALYIYYCKGEKAQQVKYMNK